MANRRLPKISDERWVNALEQAEDGNLRELVRALLAIAPVPDWVRDDYESLPPQRLDHKDRILLLAWETYRWDRRPNEKQAARIERIATQFEVKRISLENLVIGKGRAVKRLRPHLRLHLRRSTG